MIKAVLTSTHNLCFKAKKKKKNVYPCTPQFYYIEVGCKGSSLRGLLFVMATCTNVMLSTFDHRSWKIEIPI